MARIVVGIDGSESSTRALAWAATMGKLLQRELVVVNAYVPIQSEQRPSFVERLMAERTREATAWCGDVLTDVHHRLEIIEADPRDALMTAVERFEADLLVVAATGSSGHRPGFLRIGSVAEYLTHHATVALAVVDDDAPATAASRIVVAVDGSQHSLAAVRWFAELAPGLVAADVVTVTVTIADDDRLDEATAAAGYSDLEELIRAEWAAPLRDLHIDFNTVVVRGTTPTDGILRVAADHHADLVVLGMRGAGGITGLRLGGVAFKVLHRIDGTTVVLVPPDATRP